MDIQNTVHVNSAFTYAQKKAISYRHEFITPEHLLSAFLEQSPFASALNMCFCDTQELAFSFREFISRKNWKAFPQTWIMNWKFQPSSTN